MELKVSLTRMFFCLVFLTVGRASPLLLAQSRESEIEGLVQSVVARQPSRETTDKLLAFGEPAVAPLAKAADVDDQGVVNRCFGILARMMLSEDARTADSAEKSIKELAESRHDVVARRARNALRLRDFARQKGAQQKGAAANAPASKFTKFTVRRDGKSIELEHNQDGSFTGKIQETVDGKTVVSEIKAESEAELQQKFPEAHRAFQQRQPPNPAAAQVAVQGGIQINGQVFGGNKSISINANGDRQRIVIKDGDETLEIADQAGKEIEVTQSRLVNGQLKTETHKAKDLEELRKVSPDAAKQYEQYRVAQNIVVKGAGGALRMQIRAGAGNVADPGPLPPPPPVPGELLEAASETQARTIQSEQLGQKVEITDIAGKNIKVKLTRITEGREEVRVYAADDLKSLKTSHPEAAALYEQLTGHRADR